MAVGQVVYLSPSVSAEKARLKSVDNRTNTTATTTGSSSGTIGTSGNGSGPRSSSSSSSSRQMVHVEHVALGRPHMVHYVDVHLPWSHSLCACCLPRMLRPAPPITFRISSLASLRKHLQQPVAKSMPPFRLANKPTPPILAYSATVPLSAPPRRFPRRLCWRSSAVVGAAVSVEGGRGACGCSRGHDARMAGRATCRPATGPPGGTAPAGRDIAHQRIRGGAQRS
ncbi:unnamed protein product [Closterium sp. Naga37s-1]|nr:unnamed protein product [Closterium sp. Naga37s-1]CAI5495619.1 unnamed protein product [Closterium sp. Naga37s-1]